MARSKQRKRVTTALTPPTSPNDASGIGSEDGGDVQREELSDRSLSLLDPTLTAPDMSKLLLSLLRDKLFDYVLGRSIDKTCAKYALCDDICTSPDGTGIANLSPTKLAEIQKDVVKDMKILGTFMDLCISTPHVLNGLPAPKTFPDECENTWLLEILLIPSCDEGENDSFKETETSAGDYTQLPPCTCEFGGNKEGIENTSSPAHFQMSFKFTLWNEAANAPVLYKCPQDLTNPDENNFSSQGPEQPPNSTLKTVNIGACIDFRMPSAMMQDFYQHKLKARQSPIMETAPCIGQLIPDFRNPLYKSLEECSPACNTFFNELLLAINLAIPEMWCSGQKHSSFLWGLYNNFPGQEYNISDKGKSRLPSRLFEYGNHDCVPEVPLPGTFQPAKVLCHDRRMTCMIPYWLDLFRLTLAEYACGRMLSWRKLLSSSDETDRNADESGFNSIEREMYSAYGRKQELETDAQKKGRGKIRSKVARENGEAGTSESTSTAPHLHATGIQYATVPLNKSSYVKHTQMTARPQILLVCSNCGLVGVDRSGALPWPKLSRCSRCKTSWYCSIQCQKKDWIIEHKQLCMLDDGTGSSSRGREGISQKGGGPR